MVKYTTVLIGPTQGESSLKAKTILKCYCLFKFYFKAQLIIHDN